MKRDDTVYLRHILDAIAKVEIYLENVDETSFGQNSLIQDGVIRQIEIIGEATRRCHARSGLSTQKHRGLISLVCVTS